MPKESKDIPKILSENLFPVVGIGASAGGLEAFKKFIKAIPKNSGMAYVFVQHLSPEHHSSLPEILQRETSLPIHEIKDNVEVKPDNIYVIPANKMLLATNGVLKIRPRATGGEKNMPIDLFFTSLAEVHQASSIGIVLSGTGTDGSSGLKNIKNHGGVTFAQEPASAAYNAMPQYAIDTDAVDFIMEPEKMPEQLVHLERAFKMFSTGGQAVNDQVKDEQNFQSLMELLQGRHGVDFTYYKQTTIRRRILRRLGILKIENMSDYLRYVKENKAEQDILFQDFLIPVTSFFRDSKTFDNLCADIFPELIKAKDTTYTLRIWVAGCATGEEAYSMAMCLQETILSRGTPLKIQIFATDLSEKAINKARSAQFLKSELDGVSDIRLQQFFIKTNGHYLLKKNIRDLCVFAVHNFLKDPPFAKIDLISCRNVMIYMEPFLQKKAFNTFHYALNEKGLLLLGKSETTVMVPDLYFPVSKKEKLYGKKEHTSRFMPITSRRNEEFMKSKDVLLRMPERARDDFQKSADEVLLSKYTPAGVVVNERFEILQFHGQTGQFLEPPPGKPSTNILKMAKEGLSFEIRNALEKSKNTKETSVKEGIPINHGKKLVTVEVVPLQNTSEPHFLILFREGVSLADPLPATSAAVTGTSAEIIYIKKLEDELQQARADMKNISEDQEAANEELQSVNEELLSGSEELQSVNEELETSKEELQSTNEELITLNQELIDRNEQLNISRLYSEAIVNTAHEPMLVLDRHFKVKNANRSFYETFHTTEEATLGKILFSLQNDGWNIQGLRSHLQNMFFENENMADWEVNHFFPFAGMRTIHFNAQPLQQENGEQWLMLAMADITIKKEIDNLNKRYSDNLKKILENMPLIASTANTNGEFTYFNRYFLEYSGMSFEDSIGLGWEALVKTEMIEEFKKQWIHAIKTGETFRMELLLKRNRDQTYRWHLSTASPIKTEEGEVLSWVGAALDIHEEKVKAEMQSGFLTIASHELRTPLTTAKAYIQMLQENLHTKEEDKGMFINKAADSIERLNKLILQLLDISKINNGKFDLSISDFDINEMLSSAIDNVQLVSRQHKLIQSGKIDHLVKGDKERLRQVVINLLTNAVKYSPGRDKVLIHVAESADEIIVSVTDSGVGIRKENMNRIFEMYFSEKSAPNLSSGLGIGLSISAEIVERHQGRIWVRSEFGEGSTFYFAIPLGFQGPA